MESSSSSSSSRCRQSPYSNLNQERFLRNHLKPAIRGKSCPICLSLIEEAAVITVCLHAYCADCIHKWSNLKRKCPLCNAQFGSLFIGIDLTSRTFRTKHLSPLGKTKFNNNIGRSYGRPRNFIAQRRAIGISREELNVVNRRTRPLPTQRSFGQLSPDVTNERILQWRASIYEQNLHAVPCPTRRSLEQGLIGIKSNKERVVERIQPWIHRELHAVLGDSDPAVLVHLVTSLFISTLEDSSGPCGVENKHLEPLWPFLMEMTSMFWHELRCFAESSFNMETYDTVVEYVKGSN